MKQKKRILKNENDLIQESAEMEWINCEELLIPTIGLSGGLRRYRKWVKKITVENGENN